jgi:hypothetical protein
MTETVEKKRPSVKERREAEALARETQRQAEEVVALKAWPTRLMENLERASKIGMDVSVEDGKFAVAGYTSWNDRIIYRFNLTPYGPYDQYYTEGDWEHMDSLERHLNDWEEKQREEQRKRDAKARALAKLDDADREALGL